MSRAVLFDLDGVLLDSQDTHLATLAGYAMTMLGRRVTTADLPAGAHLAPRDGVLAALGLDGPLHEKAWDAATATAGLRAEPFPFTIGTLTELRASGVATGLVTLRSRRRADWLLPPHLLALLGTVVCFEDAPPKPAPDGLLLALDRLGADPRETVFVGDTVLDVRAAQAANVQAVGVGWGYTEPEALVRAGAEVVIHHPGGLASALLLLTVSQQPNDYAKRS
ncbi:HAD family hydrolase [Kitasatospora cineracea]|uniref:Phosphoglycolate phosphatase/pyrophosphatase PpaX/AHBA synthesis associated protein n=1 Tax=Kitasatospora cineracea TaxID=88074 RepID=A0A8G1UKV7_9ACTN|nr:HAD-IA family hydrolase [Kitasatospora cineracea]ROR43479.1 phosphoglycolate phosphatase/pyrophosphatase PpaX/AHBA synthesis associated protein [Kitasatospora cineracea]